MSDKLPQPSPVLWKRLHRAAKSLRRLADALDDCAPTKDPLRAYANTCDQAAGRLRAYFHEYGEEYDAQQSLKAASDQTGMSEDEKCWLG